MYRFYTPNLKEHDKCFFLPKQEAIHCLKVLRKKEGDEIELINGKGLLCKGIILKSDKSSSCEVQIFEHEISSEFPNTHLGIAHTKNADKTEWIIEKASELGISEITFLICQNNERKKINYDRLQKITVSAAKQSGRLHLLKINEAIAFNEFVSKYPDGYVAHCRKSNKTGISAINSISPILIGPEGDFTKHEIESALLNGYTEISLGCQRLRTETAAITACVFLSKLAEIID